jgi:ubiquitin-conjugating enzyme E2 S
VCIIISLFFDDDNLSVITADLDGPIGTHFELGRFRAVLSLPSDFPSSPPKGHFITKIFHPNVSASGEICVNTLKKDWLPSHGIRHVLLVLRCLLIQPNPESALNEEAGRLLMEEYSEYDRRARLMTRLHATKGRSGQSNAASSAMVSSSKGKKDGIVSGKRGGVVDGKSGGSSEDRDEEECVDGQENAHLHANSPTNARRQQSSVTEPTKPTAHTTTLTLSSSSSSQSSLSITETADETVAQRKLQTSSKVADKGEKEKVKAVKKSIKGSCRQVVKWRIRERERKSRL